MPEIVAPGDAYTSRFSAEVANTGLAGTGVLFRLLDNDAVADDPVYGPSLASIIEDPSGTGEYVFSGTAPAPEGKYSRAWDLGDDVLYYDDDLVVSSSVVVVDVPSGDIYASVDELFRILKIANPSAAQTLAAERVLLTSSGEIDSEIDLSEDADALAGWQLALAAEVCLERAVELWRATPWGIVGIDSDVAIHTARNTWERYAHMLAPLKSQWGLA